MKRNPNDASRQSAWDAKRAIALGWFEVLRLAERMRRIDAGEPVIRIETT